MANQYTESGIPVLRGLNVNRGRFHDDDFVFVDEETADRLYKFESFPGDVLLVHKGTLGQIGLMPKNRKFPRYIMGNSMMRVRCDPTVLLPEYLYYWLSSPEGQHYIFSRVSQVGVPQIQTPLATLRQAELAVPPLADQLRITHILGVLDDKIELNRKMSATLEAIARALFKSWFVDFDPVRAKAEGRDPGLSAEIAALFPDSFDETEHGQLPSGWAFATISDIAIINPEVWSKASRPDVIRYVDLSTVKWGRFEMPATYDESEAPSRAQRVLRPGDTLVGTVRPANGSYGLVSDEGLTGSTGFAVLRPTRSPPLTYLAATSKDNIERLGHLADGGAYPAVRPEVVAGTRVVLSSKIVLCAFDAIASPLLDRYAQADRESRTLAALRDALLPKLISGELRVGEAERVLAASA